MVKISKDNILTLYASLMSEIKERHVSAQNMVRVFNEPRNLPHPVFFLELAYLQLRRITELTALATLATQNENPQFQVKDLVKMWNAGDIFAQLAKLNPRAIPLPCIHPAPNDAEISVQLSEVDPEITRQNLMKTFNECGDKLHSGGLKFVANSRHKGYDAEDVTHRLNYLKELLDFHIVLAPNGQFLVAWLRIDIPGPVACRWMTPDKPLEALKLPEA